MNLSHPPRDPSSSWPVAPLERDPTQPAAGYPQPPVYRIHSPGSVLLATTLGSPAAAGVVLALNYWKWGQKSAAAGAVAAGFAIAAIVGWLAWILPVDIPTPVFVLPQLLLGWVVAKRLQQRRFEAHIALGGLKASNWIGAGIGLSFFAAIAGALAIAFFSSGVNPEALVDSRESIDVGNDQLVFYSRGATREDARRIGEALVDAKYFDGSAGAEVLVTGDRNNRAVSFPGTSEAWNDPANVQYIRDLADYIQPDIGGTPYTVRLLDENLYEVQRFKVE